jgi:5-methyltetrahydropteroyltriglutamate--homocysteine methyltransferase
MVMALNLGFPRIGVKRELKKAQESYWKGQISRDELLKTGRELRLRHWKMQKDAGIDAIPCNDFSYYDHMLGMAALLGAIPSRYNWKGDAVDIDTFFAMARGSKAAPAMEMTKWFDTNYHYIVPEFEKDQNFRISSTKVFDEYQEAKDAGIVAFPVLVGPVTFTVLGKAKYDGFSVKATVEKLVPVYVEILKKIAATGATYVQIDEPCLVTDLSDEAKACFAPAYKALAAAAPGLNIHLATYFGALGENLDLAFSLPVRSIHVDVVRAPDQLDACLEAAKKHGKEIALGLVDGRNIWRNDLSASLSIIEKASAKLGKDVAIAPSCSLLHVPVDLDEETGMDAEIRNWMAFAKQKLAEVAILKRGANEGRQAIAAELKASDAAQASRKSSTRIHDQAVKQRSAAVTPAMLKRKNPFGVRRKVQITEFNLPLFPTTTIGSFPQTNEIREARANHKAGKLADAPYETAMKKEIEQVVRFQEEIDIDVLVHGEAERNDMVEYFGEQLKGYVFSKNGWVQSYGSRCVKPPIIFGDISRPQPMTVKWSQYAQSLTSRIMKGMLTGPVTILQWSFVRDDQPRSETCKQIALAIRDEVVDLEKAGIRMIQIDEPAIREGLPLRKAEWKAYLQWAVDAFRLSAAGVEDKTQIHTHMCYSEFNDIIEAVGAMDADVISIETSRSQMELLNAFVDYKYPNEIGPGVYDIHSPRVPGEDEMVALLEKARKVLTPEQIWVNPDCGLKTRGWPEVKDALKYMVAAAKVMRTRGRKSAAA